MASQGAVPKKAGWRRYTLPSLVGFVFLVVAFFACVAIETHLFAQRLHLRASEKSLRTGMTQQEVEDLLAVKLEDRKTPDVNRGVLPQPHAGVIRYTEMSFGEGTVVNYTEWYQGLLVTSQHHLCVTYDKDGRVKKWDRGLGD